MQRDTHPFSTRPTPSRQRRALVAATSWVALAAVALGAQSAPAPPQGDVIDRILAIVNGELIMLSDATAAHRFRLVEVPSEAADPIAAALDALIERQLQLTEVNRFVPPEPAPEAIDARMAEIRARFASDAEFAAALAESGMQEQNLRARVRNNLRIASYRAQRFAGALQPSDEELLRYYRLREHEFTRDGVLQPFAEVRDQIRTRVATERSQALIGEWIETLRRRAEIVVLYGRDVETRVEPVALSVPRNPAGARLERRGRDGRLPRAARKSAWGWGPTRIKKKLAVPFESARS